MAMAGAAVMLLGEILFAPTPPGVTPRNQVERLVLARPESASRELERWLMQQNKEVRETALIDAGFRRVRPGDTCAHYVYTRPLTSTLARGASVVLCDDKPPFVLRSDETRGPWRPPGGGPSVPTAAAPPVARR
jgi:hypothetical protein